MQNARALSLIVILVLSVECSFLNAPVLSQNTTSQTIQSQGEILYASPPTPSLGSFNAVWCYPGNVDSTFLANLVSHKIFNIFPYIGTPVPGDHSITYYYSDAEITTMLNTIRAYDSRFKIYAWIGSYPHDKSGQIDLSTSGNRQAMINSVIACVNKGFDGIQDNIEDVTAGTTSQNTVDYWNAETVALHAINKKNIVYVFNDFHLSAVQADYITLWWSPTDYKGTFDAELKSAISPCLLEIAPDSFAFSVQFVWIDEMISESGPYPNLAGFAIYIYRAISSGDWTAWDAWSRKG